MSEFVKLARSRFLLAVIFGALLVAIMPLLSVTASAHSGDSFDDYMLTVGFENEPAIAEQPNAVEVELTTADGDPVNVPATLTVTVTHKGREVSRDFVLVQKDSGESIYLAPFTPTLPGDYIFRITGTVGATQIDGTYESGPDTFSPILDPVSEGVFFPEILLSQRELTNQINAFEARIDDLQRSVLGLVIAILVLGLFIIAYTFIVYWMVIRSKKKKKNG